MEELELNQNNSIIQNQTNIKYAKNIASRRFFKNIILGLCILFLSIGGFATFNLLPKRVSEGGSSKHVEAASTGYLTFEGNEPFELAWTDEYSIYWDGTIEFSDDAEQWREITYLDTSFSAARDGDKYYCYLRGLHNTRVSALSETNYNSIYFYGTNNSSTLRVSIYGDLEDLRDYSRTTSMGNYAYCKLFYNCEKLVRAPELTAENLTDGCYLSMFSHCTNLTKTPELPSRSLAVSCYRSMFAYCTKLTTLPLLSTSGTLPAYCYHSMFSNCSSIKLSTVQTGKYTIPFAIPPYLSGSVVYSGSNSLTNMFFGTGGTFTGTPTISTTYYLENPLASDKISCVDFSSPNSFTISTGNALLWNGVIYYSTDKTNWNVWNYTQTLQSQKTDDTYHIYMYGVNNTELSYNEYSDTNRQWTINGTNVSISGDLEDLRDVTRATTMYCSGGGAYETMFYGCTALTSISELKLSATTLDSSCYRYMFAYCTNIESIPDLPATTLTGGCYYGMFYGCSKIKLSTTKTGRYIKEYRIPTTGSAVETYTDNLTNMFTGTGGTFTGTPQLGRTYYLLMDGKFDVSQNSVLLYSTNSMEDAFRYANNNVSSSSTNYVTVLMKTSYELTNTIEITNGSHIILASQSSNIISRADDFIDYMFVNSGDFKLDGSKSITIKGLLEFNGNNNSNPISGSPVCKSIILNNPNKTLSISGNIILSNNLGGNDGNGSAIYNDGGTVLIDSVEIRRNKAYGETDGNGGAIYNNGSMIINNCNINLNLASNDDGIYNAKMGNLTINGGHYYNRNAYDSSANDNIAALINIGNCNINGGTFGMGKVLKNEGTMTITGGTFNSSDDSYNDAVIIHKGKIGPNGFIINGNPTINGAVYLDKMYNDEEPRCIYVESYTSSNPIKLNIDASQFTTVSHPVATFATADANNINKFTLVEDGYSAGDYLLYADTENLNLYTSVEFTITYETEGGTWASGHPTPTTYSPDSPDITLDTNITKTGYDFMCWCTNTSNPLKYKIETIPSGSSGDITVYASWVRVAYTLTVKANNGTINNYSSLSFGWAKDSSTMVRRNVFYGDTYYDNLSQLSLSRTGYTFDGWWTLSSGGTQITSSTTMGANPITIYAHWLPNQYTLTANANGGSISSISGWTGTGNTSTKLVNFDATYGALPTVTQSGYKFTSWNTAPDGSGTEVTSSTKMTTEGATIYAQWQYVVGIFGVYQSDNLKYSTDDINDAFNFAINDSSLDSDDATITMNDNYQLSNTITISGLRKIIFSSSGDFTLSRASGFTESMFINNGIFEISSDNPLTIKGLYNPYSSINIECASAIVNNYVNIEGYGLKIGKNVTIQNHFGGNEGKGAVIYNEGELRINGHPTLTNNRAYHNMSGYGGAIYNNYRMFINGVNINSNTASSDSGIYNDVNGSIVIDSGIFTGERVIYSLGKIQIFGGTFTNSNGGIVIYHKGVVANQGLQLCPSYSTAVSINGQIYIDNTDISLGDTPRYIYVRYNSLSTTNPIKLNIDAAKYGNNPVVTFSNGNSNNINKFTIAEDGDTEREYKLYADSDNKNLYIKNIISESYLNKNWKTILSSHIELSSVTKVSFIQKESITNSDVSIGATDQSSATAWSSSADCYDVKAYIDGTEIIIYSPVKIYAPQDSSSLFEGLTNCSKIELDNFDTSKTNNMSRMFYGCGELVGLFGTKYGNLSEYTNNHSVVTTDSFVTNYVTNFDNMFVGTKLSHLDLGNFVVIVAGNTTIYMLGSSNEYIEMIKLPQAIGVSNSLYIPEYSKFVVVNKGSSSKSNGDLVTETVGSQYRTAIIKDVGYIITLDNQGANSSNKGTERIFEEYNDAFYLDYAHQTTLTIYEDEQLKQLNHIELPQKNNYDFQGYYQYQNGEGEQYIDNNGYVCAYPDWFTSSITMYAYWTPVQYALNVYAYYESGDSYVLGTVGGTVKIGSGVAGQTATSNINFGSNTTITATASEHYEFAGWRSGSVNGTKVSSDATMTTPNMTSSGQNYYAVFTVKTYTITWKNDNGTIINTTNVKYNQMPTHADVSKAQDAQYTYTFAGWSPSIVPATQDAEYTAVFTPTTRQYQLKIEYRYQSTNQKVEDIDDYIYVYYYGSEYEIVSPEKTGYTPSPAVVSGTITGEVNIAVYYVANVYDIVYKDQNDKAFSGTHESGYPTQHIYDQETELKGAIKDNFTFGGWFYSPNCSGSPITTIPANVFSSPVVLYAKWTELFEVTYNYQENGGTSTNAVNGQVEKGQPVNLSYTATKEGWDFVGWNTDKNATTGLNSLNVDSHPITLYAIYTKYISATFYSGIEGTKSATRGDYIFNNQSTCTVSLDLDCYTSELSNSWQIDGFRDDKQVSPANYSLDQEYTIYGGEEYYAIYSRILTYKFNKNGADSGNIADMTEKQYYNSGNLVDDNNSVSTPHITLPQGDTLSKTGYTFYRWTEGSESGTQYSSNQKYQNFAPKANNAQIAITFYAKWEQNKYNLIFDKNTDDTTAQISLNSKQVTYNEQYGSLPTGTRTGYYFVGWFTEQVNGSQVEETDIVLITQETTIYAHWSIEKYFINFMANTGNAEHDSSVSVYFNAPLPGLLNDLKAGYEFIGWSLTNDVNSTEIFDTCQDFGENNAEVTIYAIWSAQRVSYTVEHYKENLQYDGALSEDNENAWTLMETEQKEGEADTFVSPDVKEYKGFTSPNKQNCKIEGDGSLVVKYYYPRNTYAIAVDKDNGIESVSGAGTYRYGEKFTITAVLKNGYDWINWSTDNVVYGNFVVEQQKQITVQDAGVKFSAHSQIHTYNISYDYKGGQLAQGKTNLTTYDVLTGNIQINNPSKAGYTFVGWTGTGLAGLDSPTTNVFISQGTTSDISLTANWEAISYNIEYQYGDDNLTSLLPTQYTIESTDKLPEYQKPGLYFTGWKVQYTDGNWESETLYDTNKSLSGMYGNVIFMAQGTEVELVFEGKILDEATFNSSYNQTLTKATGGSNDITYTLLTENSTLPEGLSLDTLALKISGTVTQDVGTYTFKIYAYDNVNEKEATATYTIKVNPKSVNAPVAKTDLIYNGNNQTAFNLDNIEGYSLSLQSGKDAGEYTSTASLYPNYIWKDNTYAEKQISWSIAKKGLTITGVLATPRLVNGTNQVELTGGSLVGVCGNDNVSFELGNGTISQTTSGEKLAVSTNITLDLVSQNNYYLTQPENIKVDISRIELTLENNDNNDTLTKVYLEYNQTKLYSSRIGGQIVSALSPIEKETYTFQGYFTENTAGTKMIDENYQILFTTLENDTTVYAHWLKTSFRIYVASYSNTEEDKKSFTNSATGGIVIVEGEEGNVYSQTLTGVSSINLKAITRDGYEFVGWFTNKDFADEPTYTDEEININLVDEDITLYAQFKFIPQMSKWVKYGLIASAGIVFLMANVIIVTKVAKSHKRRTRSRRFITDVDKFDKNDRFGGIDLDSLDF